ncbi:MAG: UvrD-helicase domain-containing protein, partial [Lachnospiraceae bacterium]|nr:UvrD-helicase domain-containing protein [Lachnospiraceae bacterium]
MSFQWTEEQENVIRFREGNLLVSAAAGSGKTAVLVEHLLSRMLDPDHPADADRFLVVTFTKAAAAEMRRKLLEALEKRAEAHPEDANIRRQIQLVPNAQVSTIDSFCAEVIRSHIALLDIDPAFRVGDEGEMKLLQEDVLSDLLSDEYDRADPAFLHFTETASAGKDDRAAGAWIMELYRFSRSSAYPDRWLASCLEGYAVPEDGDLTGKPWFTRYAGQLTERAEKLLRSVRERAEYIRAQGGPQEFLDHALEEEAGLEAVLEAAAGCAAPMENAAAGCAAPAGNAPDGAEAPGPRHTAFDLFEARILELPDQANSRKSAFGGVSKEAVARMKEMRSAYRTGVKELKTMAA